MACVADNHTTRKTPITCGTRYSDQHAAPSQNTETHFSKFSLRSDNEPILELNVLAKQVHLVHRRTNGDAGAMTGPHDAVNTQRSFEKVQVINIPKRELAVADHNHTLCDLHLVCVH
jgi:hypothetical protein